MTLSELIIEVENKPGVIEVQASDPRKVSPFTLNFIDIKYIQEVGNVLDYFQFVVIDFGDRIEHYKKVPDILQIEPTPRDFFLTQDQIKKRIESADINKDVVNVGDLRVRSDNMDQTLVEYVENSIIDTNTYIIRKDYVPDWVQPTEKDVYMIGDTVTHNGKFWRSLIKDNQVEPVEGVNWTEVSLDELIHVNPRSKL